MKLPRIIECVLGRSRPPDHVPHVTVLSARPNTELFDVEKDVVSVDVAGPAVVYLAQEGQVLAAVHQSKTEKVRVLLPLRNVVPRGSTVLLQVNHQLGAIGAFAHRQTQARPGVSGQPSSADICVDCTQYDQYGNPILTDGGFARLPAEVCCGRH